MNVEHCTKPAFTVIGKEGCTLDGEGFVQRLWADANAHFDEVAHLARRNADGSFAGFWGAMSDLSRSFRPWTDSFSQGLYLAGVECGDDAEAPAGWTKWIVPGYRYLRAECDGSDTFPQMIEYLNRQEIPLAGAVHDFTDPTTGKNYMYFPIEKR